MIVEPLKNFSTLSLSLYRAISSSSLRRILMWLLISSGYVLRTIRIRMPAYFNASSFALVRTDQDLPPPLAPPNPICFVSALRNCFCLSLGGGIMTFIGYIPPHLRQTQLQYPWMNYPLQPPYEALRSSPLALSYQHRTCIP